MNPRPLRCERSALPTELAPHAMGCGNVRSRSRWKALYTSRGQDSTQTISESQVFDLYAGEEMFQLFDVLFGRGRILPLGCQF